MCRLCSPPIALVHGSLVSLSGKATSSRSNLSLLTDTQLYFVDRGQATLHLDDKLVVSNVMPQTAGELFLRNGSIEEKGEIELEAGKEYKMVMEWSNFHQTNPKGEYNQSRTVRGLQRLRRHATRYHTASFRAFGCFRIGASPVIDNEQGIVDAIALAKECDAVIVCAGLNEDYESEGCEYRARQKTLDAFSRRTDGFSSLVERPDMKLPGRTDELIERVLQANSNMCVVVQSGTACEMPWSKRVPAIVQVSPDGDRTTSRYESVVFTIRCLPCDRPSTGEIPQA